jgi:hypothetical protein
MATNNSCDYSPTQYNVQIGASLGTLANVAPSATSGVALISQGSSSNPVFGTVTVPGGGTGAISLTGVLIGNGTSPVTGNAITQYYTLVGGASNAISSIAPSATSGVPLISGGSSANPSYGTALVAGGGTGSTSFNTTGVVISGASSTTALTAVTLTDGQLAIGSSVGNPAAATITPGSGISISNGHNSITISATGGGFTWHDVTGGSATLAASNGYLADSGSLTTFTMPTNNAIGDTINIVGVGTGGWKIVYSTSQYIIFGSATSTTTSGYLASTNTADSITLVCTTASASAPIFTVTTSIGNITVA